MSRGRYYHDPARKHIEEFQDFSGGLNTVSSNDNLSNRELTKLENIDLGDRGSLKRRKGFTSEPNLNAHGLAQGLFRFHRNFAPHNLLGIEGSFDGIRKITGKNASIGGWYVFNMPNEEDAYKVARDKSNELIVNGDFENGDYGWDLNIDNLEVGDSLVGKSINAFSGNNVFRIRSFSGHSGMLNEYQKKEVPVKPGQTLRAETMVRRAAVSIGNIPYRAHIVLSFKLKNGSRVRQYFNEYNVTNEWKQIQADVTVPDDAVSVLLGVGILDNDTSQHIAAYFDNAKLFTLSGNLAKNGEFEDGGAGWNLDITAPQGDSYIGASTLARTGTNVLRIRGYDGFTGYLNEYQDEEIPVKPGDRVYSRVYHREASRSIGVKPHQVHLVASILFEDGRRERHYVRDGAISNEWRIMRGEFEMPEGAVSVLLGVGIRITDRVGNSAAYFDSFYASKYEQKAENPYFEDGQDGWELDVDLLKAGDSLVGGSVNAYEGKDVLRIRRYAGHGGFYNEYQDWDKEIPTQEGEEIYAEAMYRAAAAVIGDAPYRVHLIASVKKKDGTRERFYINKYDADFTWRKMSGYFKMPKGAVSVVFGVGIIDNASEKDVAAYFDAVYARKEIQGSANSAVAIRSSAEDKQVNRGLGYHFEGIEPHKYYVYLVDFKAEGASPKGALAVRDERYGVGSSIDNYVIKLEEFEGTSDWSTQFMKFKTGEGVTQARAYIYNYSNIGDLSTVYYDNARIYEVTPEIYEKIGVDPEFQGPSLGNKFPYRVGQLSSEVISETIVAIGGKFFVDGMERAVEGDLPIQTERPMEAAAYGNNLYIASGSGLLVYNGATIAKITPYLPDNLETLYIGSNALIDNPFDISDVEQYVVELQKIQFSSRYGTTNKDVTLSVSVGKPSDTVLEYKFERRNVRDKEDYWFTLRDWDIDSQVTFKTDVAGEYQFRISVREFEEVDEDGNSIILDEYVIPKYIIKPTSDSNDIPIDGNTIDQCNRILVHWDRLILYGDEAKPDVIYISDLYNPGYFPLNNTLQFLNPRKERITSIVRYRGNLVVFTKSSIQALFGTNPENYERYMLNTDVGCIADRSAAVVQNYLIFLSYDGITLLKTVGTSESKANVELIDNKIKNLVRFDEDAVAYVRNNQYILAYPSAKEQLRYYYEWGTWTTDVSPSLDFTQVIVEDNNILALGSDGRLIKDAHNYQDEGYVYNAYIGTKMFDFKEPYATKKTREVQLMVDPVEVNTSLDIDVFVDKPYAGEKIVVSEDFEREITKNDAMQYYVTEVKPFHPDTLKKDFAHSSYDTANGFPDEGISHFAYRKQAVMAFSGSAGIVGGLQGLQVKDGEVYQIRNKGQRIYESLAVMNDGSMKIIEGYETEDPDLTDVKHTFHFGPYLIKDGVKRTEFPPMNDFEYIVEQKHPRQAIGQRADGSIVIITVDGRSDIAPGMDLYELADLFDELGCVVAYNLDGGGSAQSFVDGRRLNVYSDGQERKRRDFIYFTRDNVEIIDGDRSGVIKSDTVEITTEADIYKVASPGKGITVGTLLKHQDDTPIKVVGLGYIFKLKRP